MNGIDQREIEFPAWLGLEDGTRKYRVRGEAGLVEASPKMVQLIDRADEQGWDGVVAIRDGKVVGIYFGGDYYTGGDLTWSD